MSVNSCHLPSLASGGRERETHYYNVFIVGKGNHSEYGHESSQQIDGGGSRRTDRVGAPEVLHIEKQAKEIPHEEGIYYK